MTDLLVAEDGPAAAGGGRPGNRRGGGLGQNAYDALGFEAKAPLVPLFEAVWRRLDQAIDYPKELLDSRVEGSVALRFTVDGRGAVASDVNVVHADSSVLAAYVLALVATALEKGSPGPRRSLRERVPVQLVVEFRTATAYREQDRDRGGYAGNALTVRRRGYVPPIVDEVVQRVFERYVPPVFPLPGGFFVDVVGVVRWIENRSRPDPDELKAVRLEAFRQRFLRRSRLQE